jgi:hypothetical protein
MSNLQLSYKSMKTRHSFAMRSLLALTGSLVMSAGVSTTPAFAEEEETASTPASGDAGADKAAAPPAAATPAKAEPVPEPPPAAAPVAPQADNPAITAVGIERLKPSAFPNQPVRGINGGSLSLTFQGLQWPYMPAPSGGSRFVLGVSGWVWDDVSYSKFVASESNSQKPQLDQTKSFNQGRFVLRATPTWTSGDWFVQGQAEFVATTNQQIGREQVGGADTDDLWLRVGLWNVGDIQVGRFEGWEVFHLGMGLDLNTYERNGARQNENIVAFYGLTDMQYRADAAANFAVHMYPMDYLRFELLGQGGSSGTQNTFGGRAVGIFDLGWFKAKAGAEYQKATDMIKSSKASTVSKGIGFSTQFVFNPWLEGGLNFAQGYQDTWDSKGAHNREATYDRMSYGAFLNGRLYIEDLILGLGAINSTKRDIYQDAGNVDPNANKERSHLQSFAALQYAIFKQFYVKVVGNYAKTKTDIPNARVTTKTDEEQTRFTRTDYKEYGVRVRFSLFF